MRTPVIAAVVLAACGGGEPARPRPRAPKILEVQEVAAPPRTCAARYGDAQQAAAELASAGTVIVAARGSADKLRPYVFAHGADAIAAALETGVTDHAASLQAALDVVPAGCTPRWFVEPRIAIQPPLTDTPPARAAVLEAGLDELAATQQIVGTCGGCPVIALALSSTSPPLASAWLVPR
ncbi:MAG: hypothetical protein KIT31_07575 [Deltaproteobacteria bacterium]|nr:hypothetical protein [Deltaproteobacteria bacterium]